MFLFSDLSCHLSHYMGQPHTSPSSCQHVDQSIYYLLFPILMIALIMLFIGHEWGKYHIIHKVPITVPHMPERRVSLSSLSSKRKRYDKKQEQDEEQKQLKGDITLKQQQQQQQPTKEPSTQAQPQQTSQPQQSIQEQGHYDEQPSFTTSFDKVTLIDENGIRSIFPITPDTTCSEVLHDYATQHNMIPSHVQLHDSHHDIISLTSPPHPIMYIIPHYRHIMASKRQTWYITKQNMEMTIQQLKAQLLIVQDGLQQKTNLLTDLQSRYDSMLSQLSHLKSQSHTPDSPIMESTSHEQHDKLESLECQLAEAFKWKTQYKTLEKEAQRWKSVVKQGRLREKALERDVKEMHHWRQRARAFEKEVKELRLMKRHYMEMRPPSKSVPRLDVHHVGHVMQQQQQQQPQSQRMYPPYQFPTVIPSHTHSQSLPVSARGSQSSHVTSHTPTPSTHVTPQPTSPPIIVPSHTRRLTIGSSQQQAILSTWTPSLSTPLFDLSDSAPSSTSVSPMLHGISHDSPMSSLDIAHGTSYNMSHDLSHDTYPSRDSPVDDEIHGLVLNDDDGDMEPQLPLKLSSDEGSEEETHEA